MTKRDFNIALKYLAKGADAPSYEQLKDFAFRLWTSLHKRELGRTADDKTRAKFKAEIAKRVQDMNEAQAIFEAGLQAYRLFNHYASECEKLQKRISHLCEQIDALQDKAGPRGSYKVAHSAKGRVRGLNRPLLTRNQTTFKNALKYFKTSKKGKRWSY